MIKINVEIYNDENEYKKYTDDIINNYKRINIDEDGETYYLTDTGHRIEISKKKRIIIQRDDAIVIYNSRGNCKYYRSCAGVERMYSYNSEVEKQICRYTRFPNGTETWYDKNRNVIKRRYIDGEIELYEYNECIYHKYADGTIEKYNNGRIYYSKSNKGREEWYDVDGHIIKIAFKGKIIYRE